MTIHTILKMGDPHLLRIAPPVTAFDTDELHLLISDMFDTMRSVNGAGLAAPQIGVDLQLVTFGTDAPNPRYPYRYLPVKRMSAPPGRPGADATLLS